MNTFLRKDEIHVFALTSQNFEHTGSTKIIFWPSSCVALSFRGKVENQFFFNGANFANQYHKFRKNEYFLLTIEPFLAFGWFE